MESLVEKPVQVSDATKLQVLVDYVASEVIEYISDCETYTSVMKTLKYIYVKQKSDLFSRHLLPTRKQNQSVSLEKYLQAFKILAKYCKFETVTAIEYRDESIRDSFTNGLQLNYIKQRFFEVKELDL